MKDKKVIMVMGEFDLSEYKFVKPPYYGAIDGVIKGDLTFIKDGYDVMETIARMR